MAGKITLGRGSWKTIRGYLNSMFTELYGYLGSEGAGIILGKYMMTVSLTGGTITRVTTTLSVEPYSIMLLDASGNVVTNSFGIRTMIEGGVCVIDIYSSDDMSNLKIKLLY